MDARSLEPSLNLERGFLFSRGFGHSWTRNLFLGIVLSVSVVIALSSAWGCNSFNLAIEHSIC